MRTAQAAVKDRSTSSSSSTHSSSSWLWKLWPLMMMASLARPVIVSLPSRSTARSPVSNQPSSVKDSAFCSGFRWYPEVTAGPLTWSRPGTPSWTTASSPSTIRMVNPGKGAPTQTNWSSSVAVAGSKRSSTSPEDVSDMPQAGRMAVAGSPSGASAAMKRRVTRGTMASPPLMIRRSAPRSQSCPASWAARSAIRPKAKFGAQVVVTRCSAILAVQRSGSASTHWVGAWICRQPTKTSRMWDITMPPTWSSGIQLNETSRWVSS